MRKRIPYLLSFLLITAMLVFSPAICVAYTNVTATTEWKSAPAFTLGTEYLVTQMQTKSFIQFTAPESATYRVTVENIKTINGEYPDDHIGSFWIKKPFSFDPSSLGWQYIMTQGGRCECLKMCTQSWYQKYEINKPVTAKVYLASRYGLIGLKKDETIYMYLSYTGGKCTYNVTIKC